MASKDTTIAAVLEQLMAEGPQAMAHGHDPAHERRHAVRTEQFLGAGHYERNSGRSGYANGTKLKKIDTPAGTLTLDVPKTARDGQAFLPAKPRTRAPLLPRGDARRRRDVCEGRLDARRGEGAGRVRELAARCRTTCYFSARGLDRVVLRQREISYNQIPPAIAIIFDRPIGRRYNRIHHQTHNWSNALLKQFQMHTPATHCNSKLLCGWS